VSTARVAFVQDHLVQRGGAERVLVTMLRAAPGAEVVTPFYEPSACYDELRAVPLRTSPLNRIAAVRTRHRLTLPILPLVMRQMRADVDVAICGTSGWAQGVPATGRKIVYFHGLARWLHEQDAYLKGASTTRRAAAHAMAPLLRRWDRRTMATGDRYFAASTDMCRRASALYGVDVELMRLPNSLGTTGPAREVPGVEPGFFLCASRLMPYKNVDVLVDAFAGMPDERLVVAGDGPLLASLSARAPANVTFLGRQDDEALRWLYPRCRAVVTAAIEPFGLTPVEGGAFGRPTIALRAGGFLDTVVDGLTGVHVARPEPHLIVAAVHRLAGLDLDEAAIVAHARQYDEDVFLDRLRAVIAEELARR
jgi:glycosyltransferase involved in cell wall biosynthesis